MFLIRFDTASMNLMNAEDSCLVVIRQSRVGRSHEKRGRARTEGVLPCRSFHCFLHFFSMIPIIYLEDVNLIDLGSQSHPICCISEYNYQKTCC